MVGQQAFDRQRVDRAGDAAEVLLAPSGGPSELPQDDGEAVRHAEQDHDRHENRAHPRDRALDHGPELGRQAHDPRHVGQAHEPHRLQGGEDAEVLHLRAPRDEVDDGHSPGVHGHHCGDDGVKEAPPVLADHVRLLQRHEPQHDLRQEDRDENMLHNLIAHRRLQQWLAIEIQVYGQPQSVQDDDHEHTILEPCVFHHDLRKAIIPVLLQADGVIPALQPHGKLTPIPPRSGRESLVVTRQRGTQLRATRPRASAPDQRARGLDGELGLRGSPQTVTLRIDVALGGLGHKAWTFQAVDAQGILGQLPLELQVF
mmetsp:Transcript_96822/g.289174  ORF Transcript_96822/g.289174 Transcript_96822/m.289174 type:complete len:314 (+) Transcript_96822:843-1784(+)